MFGRNEDHCRWLMPNLGIPQLCHLMMHLVKRSLVLRQVDIPPDQTHLLPRESWLKEVRNICGGNDINISSMVKESELQYATVHSVTRRFTTPWVKIP